MVKKRLNQYKGRLTPAEIAKGMNYALANARRLVTSASLLLESGDYPLAGSISALAIEEAGKVNVLRSLSVARSDKDVAQCWREYRSHTKKNVMWLLP